MTFITEFMLFIEIFVKVFCQKWYNQFNYSTAPVKTQLCPRVEDFLGRCGGGFGFGGNREAGICLMDKASYKKRCRWVLKMLKMFFVTAWLRLPEPWFLKKSFSSKENAFNFEKHHISSLALKAMIFVRRGAKEGQFYSWEVLYGVVSRFRLSHVTALNDSHQQNL